MQITKITQIKKTQDKTKKNRKKISISLLQKLSNFKALV